MSEPLRTCPKCNASLRANQFECTFDGTYVPPLRGATIFDRYEFLETIGQGGMGVVFKARQTLMDTIVAIKILHQQVTSPSAIRRFQEEGRITLRLTHPNIVAMRDFGVSDEGYPYMVMDYLTGTTLKAAFVMNMDFPEPLLIEILKQTCDALSYLHQQQIYHRDVKPHNIMLSSLAPATVSIKLMDFGIAKRMGDGQEAALTQTGETLGSPAYMSPEQISGTPVDGRSDLYSLGCMIFECLTGTPPFVADSALKTCSLHLTEKPPTLKEASLGKNFSSNWEFLVAALLKKSPDERVESAAELKNLIFKIQKGENIAVDFDTISGATKPSGKKLFPIAVSALAALTVTSAGVWYLQAKQSDQDQAAQRASSATQNSFKISSNGWVNEDDLVKDDSKKAQFLNGYNPADHSMNATNTNTDTATIIGFLKEHRQVERLTIDAMDLPDAAYALLPSLHLQTLEMKECPNITATKMKYVAECKNLKELLANRAQLNDKAVSTLVSSPIVALALEHCSISDAGIDYLVKMPKLGVLNVSYTSVTAVGLEKLANSPTLFTIRVIGCALIEEKDAQQFVAKHPRIDLWTDRTQEFCTARSEGFRSLARGQPKRAALYQSKALEKLSELGPPYTNAQTVVVARQLIAATQLEPVSPDSALGATNDAIKYGTPPQVLEARLLQAKIEKALVHPGEARAAIKAARDLVARHPEIESADSKRLLSQWKE